jgi:hypothetical protein
MARDRSVGRYRWAVMTKVLVTGMSGTGKSSVLTELGRRGYRVVDTDDPGWSEWVDFPDEPWGGEWLWVEDRMTALLHSDENRTLFVSGCVRNQAVGRSTRWKHASTIPDDD